ncbi:DUF6049 family protein [Streptomyces sp. DH37]|uniref:DUF6049 family protein n=1 Tax=Streptomyces sp. DH37 TaxID=3040122 RepID=UPI002442FA0C|nr:DUF6049 family protein [Streptomyces sp. DH37]MDG9701140.1 DUF6049 family protein [Streptomyces sp. DH37]
MDEYVAEAAETPGTPTAPARRRRLGRCAAVLVTAVPLLAGVFQPLPRAGAAVPSAPSAPSSPAAPAAPTADESRTATISISGLTPSAPGKGDTVTVSGRVSNRTSSDITEAKVALRPGARLDTRSAIDRADSRAAYVPGVDGEEIGGRGTVEIGDLPAGSGFSFTLSVPADKLPFDEPGVYQLGVSLSGQMAGEAYERVLGIERTPLPWQPSAPGKATQLTFLWPLISSAHVTARTESGEQRRMPVFMDDDLGAEIAPGGRLQQMVALGKDLPVTWVVDPDLLASVEAMTNSYKVLNDDGEEVVGRGQNNARRWLHELRQAVEDEEVVALPFGDPDLASLAHRGKNVSGALSHLGPATDLGRMTVKTTLLTETSTDFAWPVEGAVDPSIVSVATSAGAHNVITRSDSMRESGALNHTPTAARPIGGGTTAIVADARLSKLFQGDMTRADNSVRAVQWFLAHTQSITAQQPDRQRSIVVAPQRMPTTSQARTMAAALDSLQLSGGWAEFVSLAEAAKAEPDPRASRTVPGQGSYPSSLRKREMRTEAFEEIRAIRNTLDDFKSILSDPTRVETPFSNALHRSMSTSWRGDREEAAEYRDSVHDYLKELTGGVRLVQKSEMKLSGRSATIPVTVQNNLIQDVENLELRLTSGRRIGLDVGEAQPVRVEGGHSQSVKVPTTAKANGRTWVEARLYTEDGDPWGEKMRFQVEVTEITSAVMLVISGGVLLVVLAGVRMYTQRKRAGDRPDPDAPLEPRAGGSGEPEGSAEAAEAAEAAGDTDEGSEGGSGGEAGSGQAGDLPEDTGTGRRGPSGVGEKVDR